MHRNLYFAVFLGNDICIVSKIVESKTYFYNRFSDVSFTYRDRWWNAIYSSSQKHECFEIYHRFFRRDGNNIVRISSPLENRQMILIIADKFYLSFFDDEKLEVMR